MRILLLVQELMHSLMIECLIFKKIISHALVLVSNRINLKSLSSKIRKQELKQVWWYLVSVSHS